MEFQQLSMFPVTGISAYDPFHPEWHYNSINDCSGKIFCKIDWVTMMFSDCSLLDVLRWLRCDSFISDFLKDMFEIARGYSDIVRFSFSGISLETKAFGFYGDDAAAVFDVVLPRIRLECSGSGLDFLRSIGVEFDVLRKTVPDLPIGATYHYTRIDYAYDFIDYKPEFLDSLISHCQNNMLPSGRIPLASTHGAIKCKIVTGDRKVVYLGSEQSDRFLRCYDKRLQSINRSTGIYVKSNPYNNPDSWYRIEWQLRNVQAERYVNSPDLDFVGVLKEIFKAYCMADGKRDSHTLKRSVLSFWEDLFPWREVKDRIIQKANFVKLKSATERVIDSFESIMMLNSLKYMTIMGREECTRRFDKFLQNIQDFSIAGNDRRFQKICNDLNEIFGDRLKDSEFGLYLDHNVLKFRW